MKNYFVFRRMHRLDKIRWEIDSVAIGQATKDVIINKPKYDLEHVILEFKKLRGVIIWWSFKNKKFLLILPTQPEIMLWKLFVQLECLIGLIFQTGCIIALWCNKRGSS